MSVAMRSQPLRTNFAETAVERPERSVAGFACDLDHQAVREAHRRPAAKLRNGRRNGIESCRVKC